MVVDSPDAIASSYRALSVDPRRSSKTSQTVSPTTSAGGTPVCEAIWSFQYVTRHSSSTA